MATPNRYTQLTPSRFNPLSFQEVMAVPMMKRKQHDDLLAQQELLRAGLAKVDPLDVHTNEALQLKGDINNQIQSQAESLAREGVGPNSQSQILSLNRKYNDLISPTGRLGQINNAKKVYHENMKTFVDDAVKKGFSREDALYNWQNNASRYTGYDSKQGIKNIDPLGAPNYISLQDDLKTVNSMLGEEAKVTMRNNGYSLSQGPNGSLIMVDRSGRQIVTSNDAAIGNALKYLNTRWMSPTGEGYQSASFQRMNPQTLTNQISYGLGLMRERKEDDNISDNASITGYKNPLDIEDKGSSPTGITENVDATQIFSDKNISDVENIGKSVNVGKGATGRSGGSSVPGLSGAYEVAEPKTFTIGDLKPAQKDQYYDIYNAKKAQGVIKGAAGSSEANKVVANEMRRIQKLNTSNVIIVPDSAENDILASPQLIGKDVNKRNEFIQTRLGVALGNKQKVLFNKDGTTVNLDDVDLKTAKLNGHYSPVNMLTGFGGNPSNAISPHSITWQDKDGNSHTGLLTRDATEMNKPEFRAAKVINTTHKKAVLNEGNFTTFNASTLPELKRAGLTAMRVKYDNSANTYTVEAFKDGKLLEKSAAMNPEEYQNAIYNLIQ